MQNNNLFKIIIWSLVICALIHPAESAVVVRSSKVKRRLIVNELPKQPKATGMSDSEFVGLCISAPLWQIEDAIKKGANARASSGSERYTAIIVAARSNSDPEVIKVLFRAGADVNAKDAQGQTPLIHAIYNSNPEVITALLNVGALTGTRDNSGKTALDYAELYARQEAIDRLQGKTATTQTKQAKQTKQTPSGRVQTIQIRPSNDSRRDEGFIEICKTGSPGEISNAIINGANANSTNTSGMTALMWAANSNTDPETVTTLIKAGAKVNAQTKNGWTPLIWAAFSKESNPEVITILLNAGANPKVKSSSGKMAIDYARENAKFENTEALKQLEEASR
ncbi:MAG: ankyrin repeat domain-containing protein [Synergistaceae bacterium]|nr:ankyrin repeat domain-containing protein [Synergistaceae bacterium]